MQLTPNIFKAYDIRGIVPSTLNEAVAEGLGKAFGTHALRQGERVVAVGRDGRVSGPALVQALIRGLMAAGIEVIDIGMSTTPMLYFAASTLCQSGIQVTGSHNPKDYNGFKMVLGGRAIYGDEIQGLREIMEAETWQLVAEGSEPREAGEREGSEPALGRPERANAPLGGSEPREAGERGGSKPALGRPELANAPLGGSEPREAGKRGGSVHTADVFPAYLARITGDIQLARPMKVVVDCGNGVAGASAPQVLRAIGCEVIELFSEVDGNFPNHHPDPSKPENLLDVIAALQNSDAELGLAFDGDGDRLGIVTKDGQTIFPDRQMMLFARDVLSRVPGGTIVYDVKCSQQLAPAIEAAGGKPLMFKTGHSLVKAQMKAVNSPLGGEMSGHIFFKERWYGFDDGTYAAARLLEIVSRSADPSAMLNALPTSHATPELNVACAEGEPHALAAQLQALAANRFAAPALVNTIDGLRVDWPDGFGLIRASNTTPVLVLRFEGQTDAALKRIEADMLTLLREVKPDAQFAQSAH